ncbi:MAG: sn-glycerol-3-phosphate ABC transporter ATP-binding protein UgpC [Roseibium sp.]
MARMQLVGAGKSYGSVRVIDDLALDIDDGSFTVFVGPSGCGKSTLLRMIAGIEEITDGQLIIDDEVMNDEGPVTRGISMVFQNYALYPHMNVEKNIGFGLKMAGLTRADTKERVEKVADILKIGPLLKRKPAQLSGGQRQRVAIGRAIVREPRLFLFDEPLSNLDAELRVAMRLEIAKLHRALGTTMIYVTHDQTEAMTLADKIVVLRDGAIEQYGTPTELYEDPDNLFVAGFIGSPRMNFLSANLRQSAAANTIETSAGTILQPGPLETKNVPTSGSIQVGIRPEHLRLGDDGDFNLKVTVDVVENLGGRYFVYAQTETKEDIIYEMRSANIPKPGDTVTLTADLSECRFFNPDGPRIRMATAH